MNIVFFCSVILISSICFFACSGSGTTSVLTDLKPGKYFFTLKDSTGNLLVDGQLNIDSVKQFFEGTYKINTVYNKDMPGLALMESRYKAEYTSETKITGINMNPQIADANVYITFKSYTDYLKGDWSYFGGRGGSLWKGKFRAAQID